MKTGAKMTLLALAAVLAIMAGTALGSVSIPLGDILAILADRLLGTALPPHIGPGYPAMVLDMRLPRVALAFLTGAALAASGTVMQSVLQNPLASPFGLGVSAGAGLGAAIVIVTGLAAGAMGNVILPAVSLIFGLGTTALVLWVSGRIGRGSGGVTIVLIGMVASLFFNAVMDLLATLSPAYAQRINLWQLGSFSMREWSAVWVLLPVTAAGLAYFCCRARALDVMTFGQELALAMGVDLPRVRAWLIGAVALLTGTSVAFVGIIGFVDLIAPHVARRFFGAAHRRVLPASALIGGTFMVLCDLAARTLTPPREIPIGSITALLGAPFFLYVYFAGRRRERL